MPEKTTKAQKAAALKNGRQAYLDGCAFDNNFYLPYAPLLSLWWGYAWLEAQEIDA